MSNFNNWHTAKTDFQRMPEKQKTPPFLYYIPLNGFTKNTRWRLNKISVKGPSEHP